MSEKTRKKTIKESRTPVSAVQNKAVVPSSPADPHAANQKTAGLDIDPQQLMMLYAGGNHGGLSKIFLEVLLFLKNNTFLTVNAELQYKINLFIQNFLYFFTKEDYLLNEAHAGMFISLNTVISNAVAISDFKNTDAPIEILLPQKHNLAKILALYSSRNTITLEYKKLFDVNPYLASLWYFSYFWVNDYGSICYDNIIRHIKQIDDRLALATLEINEAYFSCTYLGLHNDIKIKSRINELVRPLVQNIRITNSPDKKKIAVVSGKWYRNTAVYKSCFDFIKNLKDDYELTLVNIGQPNEYLETGIFQDVRHVQIANNSFRFDQIQDNHFGFAYFPDIGMVVESIYLANMRIAPIQAAGYGHPASTYGAEIDYWIGGADAEILEQAEYNYSERLVVIPGLGQHPVYPDYQIRNIRKNREDFIINCPWGVKKINYPLLTWLRQIIDRSSRKLLFRFLVGGGGLHRFNNFVPYKREIESIMGKDNVEIFPEQPYPQYMAFMEEGDVTLDSYPYGGYNSLVDSIYLRKPFVSFEGDRFFSRASSQILREMGLSELISTNKDEYIHKVLQLIHDDNYMRELRERLCGVDLHGKLFFSGLDRNFKKAVDFLIENHESLKNEGGRKPIVIR
jgi:predicted O-linked N-acetylglucosamine transferase (SPINDLY family)